MRTKLGFAFILLLIVFSAFKTQEASPEQLEWDTHFQGEPDEHSAYAAVTATKWQYSYTSKIRNNKLSIDFKFLAGVEPEKSWVKRNRIRDRQVSRKLLNHEQGHVYINYLLLKDGEITIRDQRYTIGNYKRLIQSTANKVSNHYSNMQDRYDKETKHGSDDEAQARWDEFLLKEMSRFD
ncbi:MAG: hypothetical protein EOO07_11690 [Chitinophagaceae bacterium]|nr:MAG: hypothetical protein EOO07_11690 [Chitinophagaceae bacterium]